MLKAAGQCGLSVYIQVQLNVDPLRNLCDPILGLNVPKLWEWIFNPALTLPLMTDLQDPDEMQPRK